MPMNPHPETDRKGVSEHVTEGPSLYCDKCGERREPEDAEYVCRKGGRSLPNPPPSENQAGSGLRIGAIAPAPSAV